MGNFPKHKAGAVPNACQGNNFAENGMLLAQKLKFAFGLFNTKDNLY